MSKLDLNKFDAERFHEDEEYMDEVIETPLGEELFVMFTSLTLQDCAEFIGLMQPDLLPKFFRWAEKNYQELDIDATEATRTVKEMLEAGEINIEDPREN